MRPIADRTSELSSHLNKRSNRRGFSLIEMLVVLSIVAAVAGMITFAINRTLRQQRQKTCLTNMMMIESTKDEYARDHVGQPIDAVEFGRYFKFKIPRCPDNPNEDYQNLYDLNAPVTCRVHPENSALLKTGP
jgi:prepilin-type N-terminal cleavage/methylation domain-containing protein